MYNQQGFQGGQQQFQNQGNRYQPTGFVQSRYQGQMSGGMNQDQQPVISHIGSQSGASYGQQTSGYNNQGASFGPVISHVGYQAGSDFSGSAQGQQMGGSAGFAGQNFTGMQSGMGAQSGAYLSQNAGFGNQQQQPVISHVGYQAGGENRNPVTQAIGSTAGYDRGASSNSYLNGSFQHAQFGNQSNFGGQVGAQTQQNPVYQATNARQQEGPVINQLGYQAGQNNGMGQTFGFQSGMNYQGR